ncbi:MAG: hypothetical protein JXR23_09315 [Pontiellaceae bacterium]|nr:hypothetical protein [Pontiellaceae bacterium]
MKDSNTNDTNAETLRSLKESEELFRTLYTNLPGGMIVIGEDYRIKNTTVPTFE